MNEVLLLALIGALAKMLPVIATTISDIARAVVQARKTTRLRRIEGDIRIETLRALHGQNLGFYQEWNADTGRLIVIPHTNPQPPSPPAPQIREPD
ncbi:hypothetical protein ABT278_35665 [Streptomyces sp. NPDC001228]|uniref:hypothetical protein n=1 Tax=Streptomyces sp. NPDC001228 TaxID=3154381 RepID=UPI00332FA2DD